VRFHFPRRNFLSGFFFLVQSSGVVILATMNCFLVLHFIYLSLYCFNLFFCLIEFLQFSGNLSFRLQWLANFSFSFYSCCIFCWTLSSSLSMVLSSSSSFSCACYSIGCSWMCAAFSALAFIRASSFALRSWFVMFEGSGAREISLPSTWWCSSWSVSVGMFFLDLLCGGIVSCFSAAPRWAPMLGGIRKSGQDPQTQEKGTNV
jgi:hypothetical protein